MSINRVVASKILSTIPQNLRTAARAERQAIIREAKLDPISTSFSAASGHFNFSKNVELQSKIQELKNNIAESMYRESMMHRMPTGNMEKAAPVDVVKANMNLA